MNRSATCEKISIKIFKMDSKLVIKDETIVPPSPVEELRARLKAQNCLEDLQLNSDKFLARYLKYNGNRVDRAEAMLQFYAAYNEKHGVTPAGLNDIKFPAELSKDFLFYVGGRDYENRPVAMIPDMGCFKMRKYLEAGEEDMMSRYILKMRLMVERLCLERNVEAAAVIVDLFNLQYSTYFHQKSILFALNLFKLVDKHAPGECSRLVIVNAPRMLKMLFVSFSKLVNLTLEVIIFSNAENDWREKILKYFPKDGLSPEFGGTLTNYWKP